MFLIASLGLSILIALLGAFVPRIRQKSPFLLIGGIGATAIAIAFQALGEATDMTTRSLADLLSFKDWSHIGIIYIVGYTSACAGLGGTLALIWKHVVRDSLSNRRRRT